MAGKPVRDAQPGNGVPSDSGAENSAWARVLDQLKAEAGETAYRSFLRPLHLERVEDGEAFIAAPTAFMRNWVATNYADRLLEIWRLQDPSIERLAVIVYPHVTAASRPAPVVEMPPSAEPAANEPVDDGGYFSAALDPRFTFENFISGKPNELAHAAARRVAEACAAPAHTVPFNPLFLYGGVGLGKTHLMHAIAWYVRMRAPTRKVIYLSAEKFMYQFIRALRFRSIMDFKEQFRSVDLLMIDDVQFISVKDSTQEEFFHTFTALVDQNRQIVVSADKSPSDLEGMEERMRSRLGWGLVADIHPTTYELRLSILESKAEQCGLKAPQKVLEFLAHKIVSNVRELEGALNRIAAHSQLIKREVTLETAHDLLQDLLRAGERRVTIEEIQKRVAEHFNIKMAEMTSARRARLVARPRQVAMYLAKQLTARSLPEIGRKFGGRDHTTVMHAVRKVEELAAADRGFAEDVELLRRSLQT